jgi:acyl-CoA thioester hydrolase
MMPEQFSRIFRIRSYECDAYGHLYNANYLRLMQETAFDASSAVGYDNGYYQVMNRAWLIHEIDIEYLLPLRYNDRVQVKTWVGDFRRVSSRRMYEFWNQDTGELAARAHADWVFIDKSTNKPARIPGELALTFFTEGLPGDFPERQPFPSLPKPPEGAFRIQRSVEWGDIDAMQHVNNAVYLDYATECGMRAVAAFRWPVERMMADGFGILLRRNQVQYLQPAFLGEELEIATWFSNPRFAVATRHYQISRVHDGVTLALIHALGVWVDLKTGRPVRIPNEMLADFAPNQAIIGSSE